MAAKDLKDGIIEGQITDPGIIEKSINVFLNHLNDKHPDVQGHAIFCLSQVISRLNEIQVKRVAETLIKKVV